MSSITSAGAVDREFDIYIYIYISSCAARHLRHRACGWGIYGCMHLCIYVSIYPSIHRSICPCIHLSIYPSVHLSIYLAIKINQKSKKIQPKIHQNSSKIRLLGALGASCGALGGVLGHLGSKSQHNHQKTDSLDPPGPPKLEPKSTKN